MQIIKKLSEMIEEELEGAEHYANCALKYRESDMMLAKIFYDISQEEIKHVSLLHDHVVRLINEHKASGKIVPEAMQAVYDYLHEKHIDHANEIKVLQMQYK